jgi:hypothetical protein
MHVDRQSKSKTPDPSPEEVARKMAIIRKRRIDAMAEPPPVEDRQSARAGFGADRSGSKKTV